MRSCGEERTLLRRVRHLREAQPSPTEIQRPYDPRELLPVQKRCIAGAFVGDYKRIAELFRSAKGVIEYMPGFTHMEGFAFVKDEKPFWADDTVWLNIKRGDVPSAVWDCLRRRNAMACDIKNAAVILFEPTPRFSSHSRPRTNKYTRLPEYPLVDYDISLLFNASERWEKINAVLDRQIAKNAHLHGVSIVDEYRASRYRQAKSP
jgi:phenylalanyl-tRNA synthetase beta chain